MAQQKTSVAWEHFVDCGDFLAECNICKVRLSYKTSVSNLVKHLKRKHPFANIGGASRDKSEERKEREQSGERVGSPSSVSSTEHFLKEPIKEPLNKRKRSRLWRYFEVVDDDQKVARCAICVRTLSFRAVSNLRKHICARHPTLSASTYEPPPPPQKEKLTTGVARERVSLYPHTGDKQPTDSDDEQAQKGQEPIGEVFVKSVKSPLVARAASQPHQPVPKRKSEAPNVNVFTERVTLCPLTGDQQATDSDDEQAQRGQEPISEVYVKSVKPPLVARTAPRPHRPVPKRKSEAPKRSPSPDPEPRSPRKLDSRWKSTREAETDALDQFGRYITLLMRRLPKKVADRLQLDIVTKILQADADGPSNDASQSRNCICMPKKKEVKYVVQVIGEDGLGEDGGQIEEYIVENSEEVISNNFDT